MMKNEFLKDLRKALNHKFYKEEIDDIIAYYDEIIDERVEQGESIAGILASFEIKTILKEMAPTYITKREQTTKTAINSTRLLLLVLLTTPVLLPIGIVYLVLLIVSFSMVLTGTILIGSGIFVIIAYVFSIFITPLGFADQLIVLGTGLLGSAIMMAFGYYLIKLFRYIIMHMVLIFSKRAETKGGQ